MADENPTTAQSKDTSPSTTTSSATQPATSGSTVSGAEMVSGSTAENPQSPLTVSSGGNAVSGSGAQVSSGGYVTVGGTQASSGNPNPTGAVENPTPSVEPPVTSGSNTEQTPTTSQTVQEPPKQTNAADNSTSVADPTAAFDTTTGLTTRYGTITIYYYDNFGAYVGSQAAIRNVSVTAPENATYIAPPSNVPVGQVAVFADNGSKVGVGTWSLTEDHRGTVVYSTTDKSAIRWDSPGPISAGYTTVSPTSPYDKWDDSQKSWVIDKAAQQAALVKSANDVLRSSIYPNMNLLMMMGQSAGPNYKTYTSRVMAIAYGKDTTSTSLPAAPQDPAI